MRTAATLELSRDLMERAYLEYRKGCYLALYAAARGRGLMDLLERPRTVDEVAVGIGVTAEYDDATELLLRALVRLGAVGVDGERYVAEGGFEEQQVDTELVSIATGRDVVDDLSYARSYAALLDTLTGTDNLVAADFEYSNQQLWDEFLQAPFYRFSRERAVEAVSAPGGRILDLAAGPGFGLVELVERVGDGGLVIGTEISRDFVRAAIKRTADLPQIRVMRGDLNAGLPFLRGDYFDGAMLVGALHYIQDRDRLFRDVARTLVIGGRFCLALAHMRHGSYDQELMDLRLRLRKPVVSPAQRDEVLYLLERNGLEVVSEEFTMGVYGWFLVEKMEPHPSDRRGAGRAVRQA